MLLLDLLFVLISESIWIKQISVTNLKILAKSYWQTYGFLTLIKSIHILWNLHNNNNGLFITCAPRRARRGGNAVCWYDAGFIHIVVLLNIINPYMSIWGSPGFLKFVWIVLISWIVICCGNPYFIGSWVYNFKSSWVFMCSWGGGYGTSILCHRSMNP